MGPSVLLLFVRDHPSIRRQVWILWYQKRPADLLREGMTVWGPEVWYLSTFIAERGTATGPLRLTLTSAESHSAHAPPDFSLNGQTNYKNAAEKQHCSPLMWNMSTDLLGGTNKEVRLPVLSAGRYSAVSPSILHPDWWRVSGGSVSSFVTVLWWLVPPLLCGSAASERPRQMKSACVVTSPYNRNISLPSAGRFP